MTDEQMSADTLLPPPPAVPSFPEDPAYRPTALPPPPPVPREMRVTARPPRGAR